MLPLTIFIMSFSTAPMSGCIDDTLTGVLVLDLLCAPGCRPGERPLSVAFGWGGCFGFAVSPWGAWPCLSALLLLLLAPPPPRGGSPWPLAQPACCCACSRFLSCLCFAFSFSVTSPLALSKSFTKAQMIWKRSCGCKSLSSSPKYSRRRANLSLVPSTRSRRAETFLMASRVKAPMSEARRARTSSSNVRDASLRLPSDPSPLPSPSAPLGRLLLRWRNSSLASYSAILRTFSNWFSTSSRSLRHWSQYTLSAFRTVGRSSLNRISNSLFLCTTRTT
mmetsp:Transcript_7635/g.16229  ORF Transcript_7635/g.16229 Transcript_7635/m.16229 type:complete len:278 (-) Transcript_7635:89-922(-)